MSQGLTDRRHKIKQGSLFNMKRVKINEVIAPTPSEKEKIKLENESLHAKQADENNFNEFMHDP